MQATEHETESQAGWAIIEWMEPLELAGYSVLTAFFFACGLIMTVIEACDGIPSDRPLWLVAAGPVAFFMCAAASAGFMVGPAYRRRRRSKCIDRAALTPDSENPLTPQQSRDLLAVAIQQAGLCATRQLDSKPRLPAIKTRMARAGLEVPRVILDRRIAKQILAIELTPYLLEPESIDSCGTRLLEYLSWLGLPALIGLWFVGEHSLLLLGIIIFGVIALVLHISYWVRSGVTPGETGLVAGVGYLEGPQGGRLSSSNVVTIVSKPRLQPMRVRLLAPDWNFELKFLSPRDPGFIAFWQRWNHPHPRPELLGGQTRL